MDQKFQSCDVPESTIPRASKKELPWFVCAAITTCLVVICYEYSESLEDSPRNTSKGATKTVQTTRNRGDPMDNELNSHADEHESQEDSDAMGRTVFNIITMIICCMALIVTWSSKSTDDSDIAIKTKEEKEETKKDK